MTGLITKKQKENANSISPRNLKKYLSSTALAVAGLLAATSPALALPSGENVVGGTVT